MNRPDKKNKRLRNNDADSLISEVAKTYLGCRASLLRFVGRFIHQTQDIEDIVHETFLRTYAAEINTQIRSPKAFLFRTARNLALKHLDKCSTRLVDYLEDFESSEVLVDERSAEDAAEAQEQFATFCRAVSTLPLQCRRAFILRKVYGLSHKEIADHLEISVSTVEKHLASGITRCSDYMHARNAGQGEHAIPEQRNSETKSAGHC